MSNIETILFMNILGFVLPINLLIPLYCLRRVHLPGTLMQSTVPILHPCGLSKICFVWIWIEAKLKRKTELQILEIDRLGPVLYCDKTEHHLKLIMH